MELRVCEGVMNQIIVLRIRLSNIFFFFQAEDGIRDKLVTGVQTCALPICIDAELLGLAQQPGDVGRVQQRLGGDAADVHAYPAEFLLLDQRRRQAELRRADGGDVAGRPSTEHDDVKLVRQRTPPLTRKSERGTGGPTPVRLFRVPTSPFRVHSSIANGVSSISFSVFRNPAPVAPSMTR